MIRNFGRLVLLMLLLAFVIPILPYALAIAQDTVAHVTPAVVNDTARVATDTGFQFGGLITAIVTAVVSAIASWFSAHRGAKAGAVAGAYAARAQASGSVGSKDRF